MITPGGTVEARIARDRSEQVHAGRQYSTPNAGASLPGKMQSRRKRCDIASRSTALTPPIAASSIDMVAAIEARYGDIADTVSIDLAPSASVATRQTAIEAIQRVLRSFREFYR
jgi:hypothetical protein